MATAYYAVHPSHFLPILCSSYPLGYPYTLIRCMTPTLLYPYSLPIVDDVPTSTPANNLPAPSGTGSDAPVFVTQDHGIGVFEPVELEHPFGPPQSAPPTLNVENFPPEELALFHLLPESVASASSPCHNPSNANTFDFNFPSLNNVPGVAGVPWSSVGAPAPNTHQTASYGVSYGFTDVTLGTQGFQPNAQSFIDQMQDGSVPGLAAEPRVTAANSPVESSLRVDQPSLAPHSLHALVARPETPAQISTESHAGTPVRPQLPMLTPSRSFSRSISAPLQAPLRRLSQPKTPLQPNTRPSTPAELPHHSPTPVGSLALPPPDNAPPTPVPSTPVRPAPQDPMQLQVATGNMDAPMGQSGSIDDASLPFGNDNSGIDEELNLEARESPNSDIHTLERSPVVGGSASLKESVVPPSVKRRRLLSSGDIPPTDREIEMNIKQEWKSIRSKRKSGPPKAGGAKPRIGINKGTFSRDQQEFMNVGRAHISWEQISQAPWTDTPEELQNRAIDVAKEVMGMRTDFVNKQFKDTMMRSESQDRARCSGTALKFAGEIIQGSQQSIEDHIVEDLFLYDGDPSNPANFFKTDKAMNMTVELFFNSTMNLGGIHIQHLLREDDLEARRSLFARVRKIPHDITNPTFDYADMSSDALRGPPIAAMAFAGIMLLHAMYKLAGRTKRLEEGSFGERWERYVSALIDHPELGLVRARIFEKMKRKYCEIYKDNRVPSWTGSRAWEWRDDLMM